MQWHILLHNVNDRAEQTEIAHVVRGVGEGARGKINTLSGTIVAHISQSTRPLRHKFRGFNKDSWLPLARECTTAVYGSGRRASGRRLLRSFHPIGVEFSYEIYAKRSSYLRCCKDP